MNPSKQRSFPTIFRQIPGGRQPGPTVGEAMGKFHQLVAPTCQLQNSNI
jgi:hypothetical protein